ncbi:MAG: DUF1501 domain-containing protein, partial [Pirellulales bacterium]
WGHVFSFVLAGAGIRGGQVYGASDKTGGYPASNRVEPQQLTASVFHLLGIGHEATFRDRTGRPLPVSKGEPLWTLLGTSPATDARTQSTGELARVPPFDERSLRDTDFESGQPLIAHDAAQRTKMWQASPIVSDDGSFGVALVEDGKNSRSGKWHATMGRLPTDGASGKLTIAEGTRAMLSQEIRNPRAGRFTFRVQACGAGDEAAYHEFLQQHFVCRLVIFGFLDMKKDHREQRVFATAEFKPAWCADGRTNYETFEVQATLRSQDGGANETSYGVGAAIVVEKVTPGALDLIAADQLPAFIRIDDVELDFNPRPRDDKVTV